MLIIGCDLHTRDQVIAMLDTETGELVQRRLEHENGEARTFYENLPEQALIGIEATGYTQWFGDYSPLGIERMVLAPKGPAVNSRRCNLRKTPANHQVNPDGVDLQGIAPFERLRS